MRASIRCLPALAAMLLVVVLVAEDRDTDVVFATGPANQVDYVAGGFTGNGDGGSATDAGLTAVSGVAVNASGDVYVSESGSCRIRRISGGVITTHAGTDVCGYGAEGVQANTSNLNAPQGLAIDAAGNLYLAQQSNCRIRRIDTDGVITTVVALTFCSDGGDGGPAIDARLSSPRDVAIDAVTGDMYIADFGNCKVKRVSGGIITTIAGTGTCGYNGDGISATTAQLSYPTGVFSDGAGNVYIADMANYRVRRVTAGVITTVAGTGTFGFTGDGGSPTLAQIGNTMDIFVHAGALYLPDDNCRVRRVQAGVITTVVGTGVCGHAGDGGPALSAQIEPLDGIHVTAGGDIYTAGGYGVPQVCSVRRVSGGTISTVAGTGHCGIPNDNGNPAGAVLFPSPSLAADGAGNLFIGDLGLCQIRRLNGGVLSFHSAQQFGGPYTCLDSGDGGPVTSALVGTHDMARSANGDLYILANCRIRKVSAGIITTIAGTGVCGASGDGGPALSAQVDFGRAIAVDAAGANVYFIQNCRVRRINAGTITAFAGTGTCYYNGLGGTATSVHLYEPAGVAVGPDGAVYISDTRNCLIRKVVGTSMTLVAGISPVDNPPFPSCGSGANGVSAIGSSVRHPGPMVIDGNNNLFFAEGFGSCRIRIIANGTINITANSAGSCVSGGNGGPALSAGFGHVGALALAPDGDIYVSDGDIVRVIHATDFDLDGVLDGSDNCIFTSNISQDNTDRNFISNAPQYAVNDNTRAMSDARGDMCDNDDDNDGYSDSLESNIAPGDPSHAAWCPMTTGDTDPLLADTDGDRITDFAECDLDSDPLSAASKPANIVLPDADSDGVPDFRDPNDADSDSDDDGLSDRIEFRNYGTTLNAIDSDGDGVKDGCEAASFNGDTIVNVADLGMLATEISRPVPASQKVVNLDVNKDGAYNPADLGMVAARVGKCP